VTGALATLVPRLRRFAIALTGSASDADDLVQAAVLRALDNLDQLDSVTRLDAWLYKVMRNLWTDQMRAARRRRCEPLQVADAVVGWDGEAQTLHRLELAAVRRALEQLPAIHRTVLTLVCIDGLSYAQSAEILGITTGTVMSRLHRARLALNEKLAALRPPALAR
jgi:RNA polymerase sigma-70 factor (ECF subfamily)